MTEITLSADKLVELLADAYGRSDLDSYEDPYAYAKEVVDGLRSEQTLDLLCFGQLVLDNANRKVTVDNVDIELTSSEYDCLWFMASNAGRVLTRDELYKALTGAEWDADSRLIDVRVVKIRAKLGEAGKMIKSVRSKGYFFVKEPLDALKTYVEVEPSYAELLRLPSEM